MLSENDGKNVIHCISRIKHFEAYMSWETLHSCIRVYLCQLIREVESTR